ncbi:MAG: hypothetical protein IPJ75_01690 [Ignavibacteriales bacterium]|nr:hypothetical protein [Ignavibacteriales bacterium]
MESPNKDVLADYIQSPGPYMVTTFNTINNALIDLKEMVNDLTDMMRQDLRLILSNTRKELPLLEGYTNIPPNKLHELDTVLKSFEARIDGAPGLASLHNISQWFAPDLNMKLLQKLHDLQPVIPPVPPVVIGGGDGKILG